MPLTIDLAIFILMIPKCEGKKKKSSIPIVYTFSAAVILVLPSASLADRAPMPTDGKTVQNDIQVCKYFKSIY